MSSARHTAREAALQMLFALDLAQEDDAGTALERYQAVFAGDGEAMAHLLGGDPDAPEDSLIERAQSIFDGEARIWQFTERLVRGVMGHMTSLDELIGRCSHHWKISRMGRVDRNVLRLAAYELAFESDIPTRVTLNEAIELAKRFGTEDSGKFVNGILDHIAQELEAKA
ncbi:MAG: transcription antitermination factor NusB [Bradymonadia bacterium]